MQQQLAALQEELEKVKKEKAELEARVTLSSSASLQNQQADFEKIMRNLENSHAEQLAKVTRVRVFDIVFDCL